MITQDIDYGKLAFMRLEDLEAGVRITANRPRFGSVKANTYPSSDITNRTAELAVFGATGSVSILTKVSLRLSAPVGGEIELRVNNKPVTVASLEDRQVGRAEIVLVGAVSVSGRENVISLISSTPATLLSSEIIISGEGVTCKSGIGINYAYMDKCAVVLRIADNKIYAQVFEDGQPSVAVRISRGISADVIAEGGVFKIVFVDDERNLWYCELIGNIVRNIRWLSAGITAVAISATEGDPLAIVTTEDGIKFGRIRRHRLGWLTDLARANSVRSYSCVKNTTTPRVILSGFNGRSVVRTADAGEEVEMGVVRGEVEYLIRN